MRTSPHRFTKAYGQWKVVLWSNIETEPFQPIDPKDIREKLPYNRFSYETTGKDLYDVEVFLNGKHRYCKNMAYCTKLPHHTTIESHFAEEIIASIN